MRSLKSLLGVLVLSVIVFTNVAFAVDSYTELAPLPGTDTAQSEACRNGTGPCVIDFRSSDTLGRYINGLYKLAVAGASVLAVLMIIVGGFNYVATDAMNAKEEGKSIIKKALGGLLLVLASWVILYTVNPQLTSLKIASDKLEYRDLSDLFDRGLAAQKAYGEALDKRIADYTLSREEADNLKETARAMQADLELYKALDPNDPNYDPRYTASLSDDELRAFNERLASYGGPSGLQEKINATDSKGTAIEAVAAVKESVNDQVSKALDAGTRNYQTLSQANVQITYMENMYNSRIDNITNSTLSQSEKDSLLNQMKAEYNSGVITICNTLIQDGYVRRSQLSKKTLWEGYVSTGNYGSCVDRRK
ncbi:MAG TPA: hypothetical protein VJI33_02930 [Candidatus Paceibacterota bacterium]